MPLLFVFPPSTEVLQTQCIRYSVVDDEILESVESFYVEISTNVPRVTIGLSTATVSLVDNDGVYVSLLDRELSVEENAAAGEGGAEISMCVQMTGIIQTEVEISLFTVAGTAQGMRAVLKVCVGFTLLKVCVYVVHDLSVVCKETESQHNADLLQIPGSFASNFACN